jgi:IS5 family transposase
LTGQPSFIEAFLRPDVGANRRLERIERMIAWAPLAALVQPVRSGVWGRPSYPPLAMLKALLLQRWYSLSDEGLEEALSDRLSFRRFCGFALDDETPDAKTICRFRLALVAAEVTERLFAELDRQLAAKGLFVKSGTLIDASLIEADVKRPPKDEGEVAERDPDAGFTRRGQKSFFGYKAHIAVDQGTDLIRGAILTGADVGDSLAADALIQGDEAAVYADKAYDSRTRRQVLSEAGIVDAVMYRRHPRRRQPAWQKWMNVALTPIRCQVERLFGLMKRSYGYRRVRYRGLDRNRAQLLLMCMAINLRRADRLIAG